MYRRILVRSEGDAALLADLGLKQGALVGVGTELGYVMSALGLPYRGLRRATHGSKPLLWFFTEYGWKKVGKAVLAEALRQKFSVIVVTIKEKALENVEYRDLYQVAGLMQSEKYRKKKLPAE